MPTLREALQQFDPERTISRPVAPARLAEVHEQLDQRLGAVVIRQPDADRLLSTYKALHTLAASGGGLKQLSNAHLKCAPWVLFDTKEPDTKPLAENIEFIKAYLRELVQPPSSRHPLTRSKAIAALISGFLLSYPTDLRIFHPLRRLLAREILPRGGSSRRITQWRTCLERCGLLEEDAPTRLARQLAESDHNPSALLEDCCLHGLLANGGLVERAFLDWIEDVRHRLTTGNCPVPRIERILAFAANPDDGNGLRYEKSRVALADGLLLPFAEGYPGSEAAVVIKTFLLKTLGDPRLTGARHWNGIDERARQVMYGWLVSATLEDFFRLLEYAATTDETARRHWRARKTFWSRYLKAGHIRDAWVALGPKARKEAQGFLSEESVVYGKLIKPPLKNHSAIVMRIGDLTITEWSHSGKFRAWFADNRGHPPLYQERYLRSRLVQGANAEISHFSGWERQVSDLIYHHTGLSV